MGPASYTTSSSSGLAAGTGTGAIAAAGRSAEETAAAGEQAATKTEEKVAKTGEQNTAPPGSPNLQKIINLSKRADSRIEGTNFFRTAELKKEMARSTIGRKVLEAADNDTINLHFTPIHPSSQQAGTVLYGLTRGRNATVYLRNTQNGEVFSSLGVKASGYQFSAMTAIHEGIHALGVGGSQRAEALARLAELDHLGVPIDRAAMRQVLTDMKGSYEHFPWILGKTRPHLPGWEF